MDLLRRYGSSWLARPRHCLGPGLGSLQADLRRGRTGRACSSSSRPEKPRRKSGGIRGQIDSRVARVVQRPKVSSQLGLQWRSTRVFVPLSPHPPRARLTQVWRWEPGDSTENAGTRGEHHALRAATTRNLRTTRSSKLTRQQEPQSLPHRLAKAELLPLAATPSSTAAGQLRAGNCG
jgi:hypothetical protein